MASRRLVNFLKKAGAQGLTIAARQLPEPSTGGAEGRRDGAEGAGCAAFLRKLQSQWLCYYNGDLPAIFPGKRPDSPLREATKKPPAETACDYFHNFYDFTLKYP